MSCTIQSVLFQIGRVCCADIWLWHMLTKSMEEKIPESFYLFVKPTFGILLEHHQVLPTKYIGNSTVASSQLSQFLLSSSANNWGCNNRSNNNNSSNNKKQNTATATTKLKTIAATTTKVSKINRNLKSLFPKNIFLTKQVLLQFFSFFKLHCNPNSFSWSHQCLWTLKPANSMQISNIKSDDCNRK